MHRITLYSSDPLDTSLFEVSGNGVTQMGDLTETVVGTGHSACYLYRTMIQCPPDEADIEVIYNGELATRIRASGAPPSSGVYVGEVNIIEANSDGSLVMEISGYDLPKGEEGVGLYAICNEDGSPIYVASKLVDAMTNLGIYSYEMKPTGAEPQDSWFPLYIGDKPLTFYGNNGEEVTFPRLGPLSGGGIRIPLRLPL